jgi:hypothetical protein
MWLTNDDGLQIDPALLGALPDRDQLTYSDNLFDFLPTFTVEDVTSVNVPETNLGDFFSYM